jgi:Spy/CpxP family protein refolding chaperone
MTFVIARGVTLASGDRSTPTFKMESSSTLKLTTPGGTMKVRLIALIAGTVGAIALVISPLLVHAQTPDPLGRFPAALERLNLTPDQEGELAQIRQNTRTQIETLLTLDQREQFKTTMQEGGTFREAVAAMNLSADQQTQLRSVFRSARQQARDVLTPEQQQEIRELIQDRRENRREDRQ